MENSTLRNVVLPRPIITKLGRIDCVLDPYRHAVSLNFVRWGIPPPKKGEIMYNNSVTFHIFRFFRLTAKPDDGPRRPLAQNARSLPSMCLLGVSTKNGYPLPLAPKFWKFCITKPFFAPNTHKSCSKCHKIS